jgi:site-specific DNA-methyltransferase (adenine-specific)
MKYELNKLYNEDCLPAMKEIPDKYFELAVVDPPYGGGGKDDFQKNIRLHGGRFSKYEIKATRTGGTWGERYGGVIKHWDVAPPQEYFDELFRISQNQIIWGGNYFSLPPTRCFLVWRKLTISEKFSMAMCEYAWTSFAGNAKFIDLAPQGTVKNPRFHPTQKPVALYDWILSLFAKPGDKIIDTHAGSASSLVACHRNGYNFLGFELDAGYYEKAVKRLEAEQRQIYF